MNPKPCTWCGSQAVEPWHQHCTDCEDADMREHYEERAAIREHLGGEPRYMAEHHAWTEATLAWRRRGVAFQHT